MASHFTCTGILVIWGLSSLVSPPRAAADVPAPLSAGSVGAEPRAAGDEDAAAEEQVEPPAEEQVEPPAEDYPANTFRLYSRRAVEFRGRPDIGLRVPPLRPLFSPHTADYSSRDREQPWPSSSVAASWTLLSTHGERDSAKAQEFRDLDGHAAAGVDAQYRHDDFSFRSTGRHLGLDDLDVRLELRRFGTFSARLDYSQIPHDYAYDARSLYTGTGTGALELSDEIQQSVQDAPSNADGAARLREFVTSDAFLVDLGHRRDRIAFELDLTAFDPLAVEIEVQEESREGSRPWSASFGLRNVVEIPWPVDYATRDVRLAAEYQQGKTLVTGQYVLSDFDNEISSVRFDNPWRITDGAPGPAAGLIDLYPSSRRHEATASVVRSQLPGRSNLVTTVSWSRSEQDDPLLPYAHNSAIAPGGPGRPPFDASDPANRPASSAGAEIDTRLLYVRWTARPTGFLGLRVHLRDYELENETARIFIPGFAPEDAYWRRPETAGAEYTNLPIARSKTEAGLEAAFHLKGSSRLTLDYEREDVDREFREVEKSQEDRFKISYDAKPAPWADFKASYLVANRDAEEYDFAQFYANQGIDFIPVLAFLRKFDQADRDRDRLQVMFDFYPTEAFTVGGHVIVGRDDYPASRFGVLDDEHEVYAIDFTYASSERLSLFGSYSFEEYRVAIAGREWMAFGVGDPFRTEPGLESPSNWSADTSDETDTVAFGLDVDLIPEKLRLDVSFTYSKSDGRIAYASPIGEVDNNPFDPADFTEVDDVTWYNFHPELGYTLGERFSLTFAYLRERYEILDFNDEGFEFVPLTADGDFNGGLFMGTLPLDFDLDVFYLTLKVEL